MSKKLKTIAIIMARGGSKGLPRKNVKYLDGKPLIAYSIWQLPLKSRQFILLLWSGNLILWYLYWSKLFDLWYPV